VDEHTSSRLRVPCKSNSCFVTYCNTTFVICCICLM